ncbi:Kunitz/Bovine pancreatic trypsin inhibitor domain protein, partial [Ostertagia ostertagi]
PHKPRLRQQQPPRKKWRPVPESLSTQTETIPVPTEAPTTISSTVRVPATQASTKQPATTPAPSTQAPTTTQVPITQPSTTRSSSTPAPVPTTASPSTTHSATAPPVPRAIAPARVQPPEQREFDARVVCALPPDAGSCFDYVPRWFFNAQSSQCEQFSYGSCGGNENNFADRTVCEIKCMPAHAALLSHVPERCTYERDGGFGKGYNVKW